MGKKVLRHVPFGPPNNKNTEYFNPGRHMYASRQSTSYSGGAAITDAYKFIVLTGKNGNGVAEDPYYVDYAMDDQTWASGPSDNSATLEHALEKAGYWTRAGGPNSEDNNDNFGFEAVIKNGNLKLIYNMGHGAAGSSAEGGEYGCVGLAGEWYCIRDDALSANVPSMGIKKVYMMYRMDASDEYLAELEEALEGIESGGFSFNRQKRGHVEIAKLLGQKLDIEENILDYLQRDALTSDLLAGAMGTASTVLKVIKYANKLWQGLKDRKEVDWLAECTVDGRFSELPRGQTHYPDLNDRTYYHFCYYLNEDFRQIIQLLQCRFNGWLWHMSCAEAKGLVAKTRICRFRDVVPLYAASYEKFGINGYHKILRDYKDNESGDKNINLQKTITVDTR